MIVISCFDTAPVILQYHSALQATTDTLAKIPKFRNSGARAILLAIRHKPYWAAVGRSLFLHTLLPTNHLISTGVFMHSNISTGLKYMLGESIDNIIQHARSERGYIFAQSYPNKKFLDICIADSGITLLGSYQTLTDNEIESDLEAIQAANRGISTKNLPNAENRGYGIITSKKMLIDGLDGSFIMMSGNALHLYNSEHQKFIETPSDIRWNGTIIALRMPYINEDFRYINYIE